MKLHAFDAEGLVAHAHDFSLSRFCRYFETGGKSRSFDDQRMVASGLKRIRQLTEDRASVVFDHRGFAVHQAFGSNDFSPKGYCEGLMAKTDAKQG